MTGEQTQPDDKSTEANTVPAQGSLHTPGPWKAYNYRNPAVHAEGHGHIATLRTRKGTSPYSPRSKSREQAFADACLIAAAPDLFDVVRDLVTYGGGMEYDDYRALVQRGEAALAKATGEQT